MLRYFKRKNQEPDLPSVVPSLSPKEVEKVNECVNRAKDWEQEEDSTSEKTKRVKYNDYSAKERAQIGKYAAENGPIVQVNIFRKSWVRIFQNRQRDD